MKHDWKLCRHSKGLHSRSSGFTTLLSAAAWNDPSSGLPLPLPLSRCSRILQRHMTRYLCTARRRDCSSSLTTRLCISAVSSLVVDFHPVLCGRLLQHQPTSRIASLAQTHHLPSFTHRSCMLRFEEGTGCGDAGFKRGQRQPLSRSNLNPFSKYRNA